MKASNFYPSASARSIRDILKYFEPPLVTIFFNFLNQKALLKPVYNGISKQIFLCKELCCAHAVTVSILQVGGFMLYTNFLWRHFEKLYITFLSSAGHSFVSFPRGNSHSSINILLLLLIVEWTRSASLILPVVRNILQIAKMLSVHT